MGNFYRSNTHQIKTLRQFFFADPRLLGDRPFIRHGAIVADETQTTDTPAHHPRLAQVPSHEFLREAASDPSQELRNRLAQLWNVAPQRLAIANDLQTLLGRVLQATVTPQSRVAVALPSHDAHSRQVLASGASYVDIGADRRFMPRQDRLDRLLADRAVAAVVYANPNPVTGVSWQPNESTLRDGTQSVWLIEDQTAAPVANNVTSIAHITLRTFEGLRVAVASSPAAAQRIRQLLGPTEGSVAAPPTASGPAEFDANTWQVARDLGFLVADSSHPWALVGWLGKDADALVRACDSARLRGDGGTATWRDHVRLQWPGVAGLRRLAAALTVGLVLALGACGSSAAPEPASPEAPAKATPAPPAQRPAPSASKPTAAPPAGVAKDLHRVPVVGGCGELCRDAKGALTGFAAALVAEDRRTRLPLYLDSSRLVIDGDPVGARLGKLWLTGQVSPRLQAVQQLVARLVKASDGVVAHELQEVASGVQLDNVRPTTAVARLPIPGTGDLWTLTLGRRGLEWLVTGVRTR